MNTNISIGIDIGKKKCDVCVVDKRGKVLQRGQYPNTAASAKEFAEKAARRYARRGCRAACETTGNMWNITYAAFEGAGIEIKLANTFKMAIITKTGKKTDRVDAEKIAQVLRMDMIPECYVPPANIRGIRQMVRQRIRIVQDRTRVINRVHALLDRYDVAVEATDMYSAKATEQLESAGLGSAHDEMVLQQCVRQMRNLTEEIAVMDECLDREAAQNEDAEILASLTGLGTYTALLLAAEIGDISRFESPKNLVSWAGMCPVVYQSGNQLYTGRIKKIDRNKIVNWAMMEAANTAVRHDDRMAAVYESARRRHTDKHGPAVVVVANKMLTIAWHMLNTRTIYSSHNERLYRRKLAKMKRARQK